jgi:hypothetical protein
VTMKRQKKPALLPLLDPDGGIPPAVVRRLPEDGAEGGGRREALGQYMTPDWAARELVEQLFGDRLTPDRFYLEPTCGSGAFLKAIPSAVPAIGVELDPRLAEQARQETGRQVLCGDFHTVRLPDGITDVVGNLPFVSATIEQMIARCHRVLPTDGRCGLLLPSYVLTVPRVEAWRETWAMDARHLPRELFPGIRFTLTFVLFEKARVRRFSGLLLFGESADVRRMARRYQLLLQQTPDRRGAWYGVLREALARLGGEADLPAIYREVAPRRPTPNQWWEERVRAELRRNFVAVGRGRYSLPQLDLEDEVAV